MTQTLIRPQSDISRTHAPLSQEQNLFDIRRISPQEASVYQKLRLKALKTDPEAFLLTLEEEMKLQVNDIAKMLEKDCILGAFEDGKLIGAIRLMEQEPIKFKHIGIVGGMYVDPDHRQRGIGRTLLKKLLDYAQEKFYSLQLKVVTTNQAAIRLYENFGFYCWATEKNALQNNGASSDQHHYIIIFSEQKA